MHPKISIVIVNYNGLRFLERCFVAIYGQSMKDFEVVFVDNGSVDGSVDYVKSNFPKVVVIRLNENFGFARANNDGIEAASGKYVLTLNNDTELKEGFLENMLYAAEKSDELVGMWAPKILSMINEKTIDSVGGLLIYRDCLARGRGRMEMDNGSYDTEEEIFIPSACAALYRRKMLDEIGFFDEDFFAYCEDTDLGLRARLAGWLAKSVPGAVVLHYYSGTGGGYSEFKAKLVERNRLWVALKNLPPGMLLGSVFWTIWRYWVQTYGVIAGKGSGAKINKNTSIFRLGYIVCAAWFSAMTRLPETIKKRKIIRKRRVVTSDIVKNWFRIYGITAKELALKD